METDQLADDNHKKGRVRRKQIIRSILNQMHFYFSDSNLSKDRFLSQKLQESEYVDVGLFLTFNKISKLTSSTQEIVKALKKSELLMLSEDCSKVKRITPVKAKANEDECIIYVQTLQPDTTHEWLINIFSEFGKVEYVSIPKYSHNRFAKGFAFIEYENVEQVNNCLEYFQSIGCRISQIDAEQLCSNKMYEENRPVEEQAQCYQRKRKHSDESGDEGYDNSKRLKMLVAEVCKEPQQKKKGSKRKAQIKELGLQVLTKLEWKKLRNRYWDMQRKKMKQLKQHLTRQQLHQNNYLDVRNPPAKAQATETGSTSNQDGDIKQLDAYVPGVIVQLKLHQPWTEARKIKSELKHLDNTIQYVDVPVTTASDQVYIRFVTADSARNFCCSQTRGKGLVLEGEEEKQYWEKIKTNRDARLHKDAKKQRGRDKLLKRAERELGKHIRFDDTEDP